MSAVERECQNELTYVTVDLSEFEAAKRHSDRLEALEQRFVQNAGVFERCYKTYAFLPPQGGYRVGTEPYIYRDHLRSAASDYMLAAVMARERGARKHACEYVLAGERDSVRASEYGRKRAYPDHDADFDCPVITSKWLDHLPRTGHDPEYWEF